ncbi:hypothetical protein LAV73_20680 [Lysinibacillus xylanilyticus]|uniref:hypothetical protein n=1 Tax=Lysinibacillus xylanilyticus TaxID=582475 RepID=UPI002B243D58|nr:hypothetical protein [Lysinibacillus xylanilyticus]MEB2282370.1 hypothetical protein [Lysinibacillus xylanilyticus]
MVAEKKVKKMLDLLEKKPIDITELKEEIPKGNQVSISNLRNTKKWLPLIEQFHTVEVVSSEDTVAQLNRPDLIPSLLQEINSLHDQYQELLRESEKLKMDRLYGQRVKEMEPMSEPELATKAINALDELMEMRGSGLE